MTNKQIPQVTERNTKKEILEALDIAVKTLEAKNQGTFNPAQIAEEKVKTETVAKATTAAENGVASAVTTLQTQLENLVAEITGKHEVAATELKDINAAISIKKAELKELLEIEVKATTLAGLIQAHHDLSAKQKADFEAAQAQFNAELQAIRDSIQEAKVEFNQTRAENAAALAKEEERRKEEFEYEFKRSKQARENDLQDTLNARRKQLAQEREAFEKEKEELAKREENVAALEEKVASIPTLIEEAAAKAAEEAKKKAEIAHGFETRAIKAKFEAEERVLQNEVAVLKESLFAEREAHRATNVKLEAAYASVESVAKASVEGARTENAVNRVLETINKDSKK